jgi:DNA replication initiation complex subunit (GINS family)
MEIIIDRKLTHDIETDSRMRSLRFGIRCLKEKGEDHKGQEVAQSMIGKQLELLKEDLRQLGLSRYGLIVSHNVIDTPHRLS